MDFNLAPLRYRNILSRDGGPIEKIEIRQLGAADKPEYEAVAFLSPALVPPWHRKSALYSGGHGGGTHKLRNIACHMAISEAMERWAFLGTFKGADAAQYGFDIDPSTSGMAAFPGLTTNTARERSDWEAVERWALPEWWDGRLSAVLSPGSNLQTGTLQIKLPFMNRKMVITWSTLAIGKTAYGFAAADDTGSAILKAQIEKERNAVVLSRFDSGKSYSTEDFIADKNRILYDRRLVFFSTPDGKKVFWDKVTSTVSAKITAQIPTKIVDREIPGAWSRYATVWRTLYASRAAGLVNETIHNIFVF